MCFKGKHEAAHMELRFINKTGNRHFDKPSYWELDELRFDACAQCVSMCCGCVLDMFSMYLSIFRLF